MFSSKSRAPLWHHQHVYVTSGWHRLIIFISSFLPVWEGDSLFSWHYAHFLIALKWGRGSKTEGSPLPPEGWQAYFRSKKCWLLKDKDNPIWGNKWVLVRISTFPASIILVLCQPFDRSLRACAQVTLAFRGFEPNTMLQCWRSNIWVPLTCLSLDSDMSSVKEFVFQALRPWFVPCLQVNCKGTGKHSRTDGPLGCCGLHRNKVQEDCKLEHTHYMIFPRLLSHFS